MKLQTLICILLLLSATACNNDFLNLKPNNAITDENFYQTQADAIAATNAVYSPAQGLYNGAAWQLLDVMSDNSDKGGGGANDGPEVYELDNFTLTTFNPMVNNYYGQCYQGIQRANIVISKVPSISMSSDIKNRCLGEARFLRGFYYYMLVRLFGDVPLYTKPITLDESYNIGRASKAQVYDTLLNDFAVAAKLLPGTRYVGEDRGRVTKWAALGMAASAYLTIGDKPKAASMALDVINNAGVFGLNGNYADNFDITKENGFESLFEIQYRNAGQSWSFFGQGSIVNCFFAPRLQNIVQSSGYGFNIPTQEFMDKYERNGAGQIIDSVRRKATVWIPGDRWDSYVQPSNLEGSPRGYNVRKYFVPVTNTAADAGGWSCSQNLPVLRFAEVLLIAAEALGPGAGEVYLNRVRARAKLNPIQGGLSQSQYQEAIYRERQVELAFEFNRWFDLLRHPDPNYMLNTMRAQGKNIQEKHKLMPIPQNERDKNRNLTQNPGY